MPLHVLSAGSTLHGLRACAGLAGQSLAAQIEIAADHGHNIRDAVLSGTADADVVLLPADMIEALARKGLAGEYVPLGTVGIGGVVRAGAPHPEIVSMALWRAALVAADAVLLTNAPTGDHLVRAIAQAGLSSAVAPKLLRFDTASALNIHLAARSDNALGFAPETEIRAGKGVAWVGDVPQEIQLSLPYTATMLTRATEAELAQRFLAFLTTPPAREAFAKSGVCGTSSAV
jgi:molybdate transport system substrate-binding protein